MGRLEFTSGVALLLKEKSALARREFNELEALYEKRRHSLDDPNVAHEFLLALLLSLERTLELAEEAARAVLQEENRRANT